MINLMLGDCLERMKEIPDKSVDMVLCDPPYGTTACKWDSVIPFEPMWASIWRVCKDNAAVVLFSKQPFTSALNNSQLKHFKQELIWQKNNHDNHTQAKRRFLNILENVSVFYKRQCTYNPQGVIAVNRMSKQGRGGSLAQATKRERSYFQTHRNYPKNILEFKRDNPQVHPTQKPVKLLEHMILTYTDEGETVLDFTMGSGSTGVAAKNLDRSFIGIEKDPKYFEIASKRING